MLIQKLEQVLNQRPCMARVRGNLSMFQRLEWISWSSHAVAVDLREDAKWRGIDRSRPPDTITAKQQGVADDRHLLQLPV